MHEWRSWECWIEREGPGFQAVVALAAGYFGSCPGSGAGLVLRESRNSPAGLRGQNARALAADLLAIFAKRA
jgi:hypothetical protein